MGRETDPLLTLDDPEAQFRHLPFDRFRSDEATAFQLPVFLQRLVLIGTELEGDRIPCLEFPRCAFEELVLMYARDGMEEEPGIKREPSLVPGRPCRAQEIFERFGVGYVSVHEGQDGPPAEQVRQRADDARFL